MTDWNNRKRACDRAASEDAQENENKKADWVASGLSDRYEKKWRELRAQIEATQEREDLLEPLRRISVDANVLWYNADGEVSELAGLIERLADYLIAKESN